MRSSVLDEGFRNMLKGIPAQNDVGLISNYSEALIELHSGGPNGVPTEWLGSIYVNIKNELFRRGVDIEAGIIGGKPADYYETHKEPA